VKRVALLMLAILLTATPAFAQGTTAVRIGDRVRATLAGRLAAAPLIGTVISVSRDTLVIEREDGSVRALAAARVEKVEVGLTGESDSTKDNASLLVPALFLVPVAILFPVALIKGEAGGGAVALGVLLVSAAAVGTFGGRIGSGPEDLWFEADWPPPAPDGSGDPPPELPGGVH
jgi:hypothetical protein